MSCMIELAFAVLPQGVPRWASFPTVFFSLNFKLHFGPIKSIVSFEAFRNKIRFARGIFLFESLNQVVEIRSSIKV